MMQSICFDLRSRKQAVEISVGRGIQNMTPPERLPRNIYGTDGVWELYSTPSRDARLKTAFKEMYDLVVAFIDMDAADAPRLRYDGNDLAGDLLAAWGEQNAACDISYVNSDGRTVPLSIEMAIAARKVLPAGTAPSRPAGTRRSARCATRSTGPMMSIWAIRPPSWRVAPGGRARAGGWQRGRRSM